SFKARRAFHARHDLSHNLRRIFVAGVVTCHHHMVGLSLRDRTHQATLASVSVSPTAEYASNPTTARLGHTTQGLKSALQRIGRVSIIHDDHGAVAYVGTRRLNNL